MSESPNHNLVPFSLVIKGLVSADQAKVFYERVSEVAGIVGEMSTAQAVSIGFNLPAIGAEEKKVKHQIDEYIHTLSPKELSSEELEITLTKLGDAIKTRRIELRFSQSVLAEAAGISQSYLSQIERAHKPSGSPYKSPMPEAVVGLARSLGIEERSMLRLAGYEIKELSEDSLS